MFDVFVATPYSDKNINIVEDRVYKINKYMAKLLNNNITCYSTVSSNHHLSVYFGLPLDYLFWKKQCIDMISSCKEVHVLMSDGWEESGGVSDEIKTAKELGKPIKYVDVSSYKTTREVWPTKCDYCYKYFDRSDLKWVYDTSVLACRDCIGLAEEDYDAST